MEKSGFQTCCCVLHLIYCPTMQVQVPKNTALIMAREKEYGHITILRFALLAGPSVSREASKSLGGGGSIVPRVPPPSLISHPCQLIVTECQREVILALEAIQVLSPQALLFLVPTLTPPPYLTPHNRAA